MEFILYIRLESQFWDESVYNLTSSFSVIRLSLMTVVKIYDWGIKLGRIHKNPHGLSPKWKSKLNRAGHIQTKTKIETKRNETKRNTTLSQLNP